MADKFTYAQRRIMVEVAFASSPPKKGEVRTATERNQLERHGYLIYEDRPNGPGEQVVLSDKGWGWLNDNLGVDLIDPKKGSNVRRSYTMLANALAWLGERLKARDLSLAEFVALSDRDEPPSMDGNLEQAVQQAYARLSGGRWNTRVHLSDLRPVLSEVSRDQLDGVLLELQAKNSLVLMSHPTPSTQDEEAAVRLPGGIARHIVYMEAR